MPIVSVRMDEADHAWVKEHAGNVSAFVRDAVRRAIEADRFKASQDRLYAMSLPAIVPSEVLIRRARDADPASRRVASLEASRDAVARARAARRRTGARHLLPAGEDDEDDDEEDDGPVIDAEEARDTTEPADEA